MKSRTAISIFVASILALTSMSSFAQQGQQGGASADRGQQMDRGRTYDRGYDRDRSQDRSRTDVPDQDRDRDRDQDQIHDPANLRDQDIYGHEFMSPAEFDQYRQGLGSANSEEARMTFQAQHENTMQQRARVQDKDLVPPGQGPIYGGELMSVQERNEYREQLRLSDSDAERQQLEAQHGEQMNARAHALNLEIEIEEAE